MKVRSHGLARRALALGMAIICFCLSTALASKADTLEFGSRGAEVLKLQKALLALGFNPNGTDGKFGRGTETAVMAYQTSRLLTADGKAGTLTLQAIYAEEALLGTTTTTPDNNSTGTQTATSSGTLKYGDSGTRVLELQTALNQLGFNTNGIDGRFGAGTQRAVSAFQKANGLYVDGLAGKKTLDLVASLAASGGTSGNSSNSGNSSSSGSSASTGFTRTLRKGYVGDDVKQVQQRLKDLGYYSGSIDGNYGTGSMAAVQAFQRRNGLSADGLAGSQTFTKLFAASAIGADSSSGSSSGSSSSGSSSSSTTYVTLRPGATGDSVRKLQKALADLKYSVTVDGSYGNGTKEAVTAFQKRNSLTADGLAGAITQARLYSGSAIAADSSGSSSGNSSGSGSGSAGSSGTAQGPNNSSIRLLHWFNDIKPTIKSGQSIVVFDPATNLQWTLKLYSLGRHADSEPKSAADTQIMFQAFGNTNTWTPKPVYVQLPNGTWTLATTHNVPHLSGSVSDNEFDGHLCVHFLRDMDECKKNDPDYGVTNQNAIRKKWKELTGETIP